MSAQPASFGSTNPFRRTGPPSSLSGPAVPPIQISTVFDPASPIVPREEIPSDAPPARTKVVKKVRVQSPPPSSPESAPSTAIPYSYEEDTSEEDTSEDGNDPFEAGDDEVLDGVPDQPSLRPSTRPPPNPFSKTLQDIEQGTREETTPAAVAAKGGLDVDAFRRLLLTGQAGIAGASQPPQVAALHTQPTLQQSIGDNSTETSSISRQSIFETTQETSAVAPAETPRTSHEITDQEEEERGLLPSTSSTPVPIGQKKKPPPPSSRHGKLIKLQLKEDGTGNRPTSSSSSVVSPSKPMSPSDVNKPLPPAPRRQSLDEVEDIFDREAAGKLPEPGASTPPLGQAAPVIPTSGKKPTPAPPPRRHARGESKNLAPPTIANISINSNQDDEAPPRSSLESQRSRADSMRNSHAPAPPPPRRPHVPSRHSSTLFASPSAPSFPIISSPTSSVSDAERSPSAFASSYPYASLDVASAAPKESAQELSPEPILLKVSPPPPPPARNLSVRRPASVRSMEATSRRISGGTREKENMAPPPPPPPRQRGSSRGSMDGPAQGARRQSVDSVRILGSNLVEESDESSAPQRIVEEEAQVQEPEEIGKGPDILADLDALQREIDALTGQFGKAD